MTPPMPTSGASGNACATSATMRSATGLIAGPQRPPVRLPRNGRRVWRSSTSALKVLTSDSPSAPAPSAAAPISVTSRTFGVSLASRKRPVASRQAPTTSAVAAGSAPICSPLETLGQEMLSS